MNSTDEMTVGVDIVRSPKIPDTLGKSFPVAFFVLRDRVLPVLVTAFENRTRLPGSNSKTSATTHLDIDSRWLLHAHFLGNEDHLSC